MKKEQIEQYRKAADDGSIPDDKNPLFLLSGTGTDLLIRIINREFSVVELARLELANRGLDMEGRWVGFEKAADIKNRVRQPRKGRGL